MVSEEAPSPIPLQGACLYMPATHPALPRVLSGESVPGLRVAVVCLEDALANGRVAEGMRRIQDECRFVSGGPRVYVRPRDPAMLQELLSWDVSAYWCGFVLPKIDVTNAETWLRPFIGTRFSVMPILETADVFDPFRVRDIIDIFRDSAWHERVEVVRIGATDLFSILGARRSPERTIYESILGSTLSSVAALLMSKGFHVSAPVVESIARLDILDEEIRLDVDAGFVGKTAVHPKQVERINLGFQVSVAELNEAQRIGSSEEAVFQSRGSMCEPRPHLRWAQRVIARAEAFGVAEGTLRRNSDAVRIFCDTGR